MSDLSRTGDVLLPVPASRHAGRRTKPRTDGRSDGSEREISFPQKRRGDGEETFSQDHGLTKGGVEKEPF
jgi:hypothetical protein